MLSKSDSSFGSLEVTSAVLNCSSVNPISLTCFSITSAPSATAVKAELIPIEWSE